MKFYRMIKETDGDSFEVLRSLEQELTFEFTAQEFARRKVEFGAPQMKTLGLVNGDGIYTNLGLLLSEQCTHTIKAATFQGADQSISKDRREFSGSLLQQLHEVYGYIDLRNRTSSTFAGLLRIDKRDYPEVAVREALLNSLVHRDYGFSASTLISVYSDRIEFISIGGLPTGVTLDDVLLGLSVCRNPKLANVFYRLELIEAYGTGLRKIMNAYKGSGKTPEIETTNNGFKIILPNLNEETATQSVPYHEQSPGDDILWMVKEGPVSRLEVEQALGVSQATAARLLKQLIQNGKLVQQGRGKNTRYILPKR